MISNISALLFSLVLLVLSSCLLVDIIWYQEADNYAMSGFYILKGPFKYYAASNITQSKYDFALPEDYHWLLNN